MSHGHGNFGEYIIFEKVGIADSDCGLIFNIIMIVVIIDGVGRFLSHV